MKIIDIDGNERFSCADAVLCGKGAREYAGNTLGHLPLTPHFKLTQDIITDFIRKVKR